MQTRIYTVKTKNTETPEVRLVEATSASAAVRYCARNVYEAKAATPKDIATVMSAGAKVERATETEQTTQTTTT